MKVGFSTLGCRVNQYESEAMAEKFINEGYEIVDFNGFADVYVINTCSVTNMGDKKSRQFISKARRENPDAIIAVVGCYSQIASTEVSGIEGVDVVLGTRNKGDIIYYINKAKDEGTQQVKVGAVLKNKVFEDLTIDDYQDKTRAFLKIQDGCNRFCTYCIIPYTRGSICSKNPVKVVEEVKKLASNGFKEIILSGIHIASYGDDFEDRSTLVDLLEKIEKIDGIERVRIGSIEPNFFTEDVVNRIFNLKKLCPQFHLSLQSGCDGTLKRMNRRYTAAQYEEIVNLLKDKMENISITTDIIVGFPGETDEEFAQTYKFLERIKLSKLHVFKYSPRKGTKAELMENQVDGNKKEERSKALIELTKRYENDFAKAHIGKTLEVLFEMASKEEGVHEGYTRNYLKVEVHSDKNIRGQLLNVKIVDTKEDMAIGEIV